MIIPRPYQNKIIEGVYDGWNSGINSMLGVSPTGSGKTYVFSFIARDFIRQHKKPVVVMAHRDVLLSQISLSLATIGVHHDLLCNRKTKRFIGDLHYKELNNSFYTEGAPVIVTSVPTLNVRDVSSWSDNIGLWIMDEAHHCQIDNMWGNCIEKFPNALGLGVTATPERTDGGGLGIETLGGSGYFGGMVEGATMSELIELGNLTSFVVKISPHARQVMHQLANVPIKFGELSAKETAEVLDNKYVVGDVVGQYIQHAKGKRGITFGHDIKHCEHIALAYNQAGVSAVALSSNTPDKDRWDAIEKFKSGEILNLVNCKLFGEGFDVPACEVVSMASATLSYQKFAQEFGRGLRPSPGKKEAIILDHVGNVLRHKTPEIPRYWTLGNRSRSNNTQSEITDTSCLECLKPYDKNLINCPWCGEPNDIFLPRTGADKQIKVIDGELVEMTREELQALWDDRAKIDIPPIEYYGDLIQGGMPKEFANVHTARHRKTAIAQAELRVLQEVFALKHQKLGLNVIQAKRFYAKTFGIDVVSAQTLRPKDANDLIKRMKEYDERSNSAGHDQAQLSGA